MSAGAILVAAVALVAALYSAVGHGGGSGYIAVMSLAGMAPEVIRPAALLMNILVASITTIQFARAGHFDAKLFWPFALGAAPLAFWGGSLTLPSRAFQVIVGLVLWFSAARFFAKRDAGVAAPVRPQPVVATPLGAALGFLAGLTGTGGGIFLTPLLLWKGWADPKVAAGVSAPFILMNAAAGLFGYISAGRAIPEMAWPLLAAAGIGGAVGSTLGSRRLPNLVIQRLLAVVLVIAGAKLVFKM